MPRSGRLIAPLFSSNRSALFVSSGDDSDGGGGDGGVRAAPSKLPNAKRRPRSRSRSRPTAHQPLERRSKVARAVAAAFWRLVKPTDANLDAFDGAQPRYYTLQLAADERRAFVVTQDERLRSRIADRGVFFSTFGDFSGCFSLVRSACVIAARRRSAQLARRCASRSLCNASRLAAAQ